VHQAREVVGETARGLSDVAADAKVTMGGVQERVSGVV
jgi:hypothetical protein